MNAPAVLLERVDLNRLYWPFVERLVRLLTLASERGADFYGISAWRSYAEQDLLYAQGRIDKGAIVTRAKGGESWHNFGLACDLCRDGYVDRRGLQPDWRPESYEVLRELAAEVGLEWGGDWKHPDRPHVQLAGLTSRLLAEVRAAYETRGILAAWDAVSSRAA